MEENKKVRSKRKFENVLFTLQYYQSTINDIHATNASIRLTNI